MERQFQFLSWEALARQQSPKFLIHEVLVELGVVLLYGESGCGKTFIVLDMACSIASGCDFMGLETQHGSVLYLAGEGYWGLAKRIRAWERKRGISVPRDAFHLTNDTPALADRKEVTTLISQLKAQGHAPKLIVVDTLSTHSSGREENSNTEMALFIEGTKALSTAFLCPVIVVHHTTKDGNNFRGGYSLKANSDTVIRVDGAALGQPGVITCEKQRDFEAFEPLSFLLEKVFYGPEDDVDSSSLVLTEAEDSTTDSLLGREKPLTEQQKRVLEVLTAHGPLSRKDLLTKAAIPEGSWRVVTTPLRVRGLVEKEEGKRGVWKLSEPSNNT